MILAAGHGTRLRPLTHVRPKVLAPIMGTTILDFWLHRLNGFGVESVILNAFHLGHILVKAVREGNWTMEVEARTEPVLLDTGGGIRNVLDFFGSEPFVVVNGDIVSNANLSDLYERHRESGAQVSLLLHDIPSFNNVAVAKDGTILGFGPRARELASAVPEAELKAFTGIQVIHPEAVEGVAQGMPSGIISHYTRLIEAGNPPQALFQEDLYWRETGSVAAYLQFHEELAKERTTAVLPIESGSRFVIHPSAVLAPDTRLKGFVVVGAGCRIAGDVHLEDTILWDNVHLQPGTELCRCVVGDGVTLGGAHKDTVIVE